MNSIFKYWKNVTRLRIPNSMDAQHLQELKEGISTYYFKDESIPGMSDHEHNYNVSMCIHIHIICSCLWPCIDTALTGR